MEGRRPSALYRPTATDRNLPAGCALRAHKKIASGKRNISPPQLQLHPRGNTALVSSIISKRNFNIIYAFFRITV